MDSPLSMQFELPSPESDLGYIRAASRLSPEARRKIRDTTATSFGRLTTPYAPDADLTNSRMTEEIPINQHEGKVKPLVAQLAQDWNISSTRVRLNTFSHLLKIINKSKALTDSIRNNTLDGILDMDGEFSLGKRSISMEDFYEADLFRPSKKFQTFGTEAESGLQNVIFDYPDNFSIQSFCEIQEAEQSKKCLSSGTVTPTCDNGSSIDSDVSGLGMVANKKRLVQLKLKSMVSASFSHKSEADLSNLMTLLYRTPDL